MSHPIEILASAIEIKHPAALANGLPRLAHYNLTEQC
jgi:hypothetical protein